MEVSYTTVIDKFYNDEDADNNKNGDQMITPSVLFVYSRDIQYRMVV